MSPEGVVNKHLGPPSPPDHVCGNDGDQPLNSTQPPEKDDLRSNSYASPTPSHSSAEDSDPTELPPGCDATIQEYIKKLQADSTRPDHAQGAPAASKHLVGDPTDIGVSTD
ncbi:hypothetical protein R1flu_010289 [Riccia fluitans]|uniref:Uncharacterized protein n=1 Tax=Riccia fluitans TaxID=41844 RepID=A0ABD1Z4K0_9MARC